MSKALGTRSTLTAVNTDPALAVTAHAVLGTIVAQAILRDHLRGAIQAFTFDADNGLNVVVGDAGQRQHLANALGLPGEYDTQVRQTLAPGVTGVARTGTMLGLPVAIWSVEDADVV